MSTESQPRDHFETVSAVVDGLDGTPLRLTAKMPKAEYFRDESVRLTEKALRGFPSRNLGWVAAFNTVITFREKIFRQPRARHQLRDYRDESLPPESPPVQIQLLSMLSSSREIDGEPVVPTEFKFYTPSSDELSIVRLEHLTDVDITDPRLEQTVKMDLAFNPTKELLKDRLGFYTMLVYAAGEKFQK